MGVPVKQSRFACSCFAASLASHRDARPPGDLIRCDSSRMIAAHGVASISLPNSPRHTES